MMTASSKPSAPPLTGSWNSVLPLLRYPEFVVFPSSFSDFLGNTAVVDNLRAAIATGRLPHSLVIAGARGSGKYTLALMLTMAQQCEVQPREQSVDGRDLAGFCGHCRNCTRILESADLNTRVDEAVAAREEMRETDKKDTRVLVQDSSGCAGRSARPTAADD